MKKENIGAVVILAGITIIGFIWFKRNKPTTADKQLTDLTNKSTGLKVGSVEDIDKPFQYNQEIINNAGHNMYSNLTPAEIKELKDAVNQACPSCANLDFGANLSNQIAQGLQNVDFSHLNLGFPNIDWSNIKIK